MPLLTSNDVFFTEHRHHFRSHHLSNWNCSQFGESLGV